VRTKAVPYTQLESISEQMGYGEFLRKLDERALAKCGISITTRQLEALCARVAHFYPQVPCFCCLNPIQHSLVNMELWTIHREDAERVFNLVGFIKSVRR
jgi:hypothetical protein